VGAVVVVVTDVFREQPFQMAFIHHDNMIHQVSAAALDPTLRHTVGSGRQLHSIETIQNDVSA
jgi:hypothetical protein